jgi:hypothetical protein
VARFDVQPGDRQLCGGCGQTLVFDRFGYVSDAALAACEGSCDWQLVERRGVAVAADVMAKD